MSKAKTSWILDLVDQVSAPMRDLSKTVDETTKDTKELQKEFNDLSDDINKTGEESKTASKEVGGIFDGLDNQTFDQVENGLDGVTSGIWGMVKASLAWLATPVGWGIAALAGIGLATREFINFNEEAMETNRLIQQITGATGPMLDGLRVRAKALEESFGVGINETLEIAKNNVEAFKISYDEAFDIIENGLIRGGQANGEFFQSLKEYPRFFAQAGFSMAEFQRVVNTGIDMGLYSDKLPDAIKEFSLSINEQTQSTRDSLENAFGKSFTDKLFANIRDGAITPKRALQEIAEESERIGLNAQQSAQLTADLFRGAGEDAGGFKVVMDAVNTSLNESERPLTSIEQYVRNITDATLELEKAQNSALNSKQYQAFSEEIKLFWIDVKIAWYEGVGFITDLISGWTREMTQLIHVAVSLPGIWKTQFSAIKEELGLLLDTFMSFGGVVGKVMRFDFSGAKESFANFKADLKSDLSNLATQLVAPVQEIKDKFNEQGQAVDNHRAALLWGRELLAGNPEEKKETGLTPTTGGKTNSSSLADTKDFGIAGAGGGGKSITMNLDITNHFSFAKGDNIDLEAIAMKVVGKINERLRDSVIAMG